MLFEKAKSLINITHFPTPKIISTVKIQIGNTNDSRIYSLVLNIADSIDTFVITLKLYIKKHM